MGEDSVLVQPLASETMNGNGLSNGHHRAESEENLHKPTTENGGNHQPHPGVQPECDEPNVDRLNCMGRLSYYVSMAIGKFFYR